MHRKRPSDETLVVLRGRLEDLPARSAERGTLIQCCADLHGVAAPTVYRALREQFRPRALHRRDCGRPRRVSRREMERFCELVAAMKLRTTNRKAATSRPGVLWNCWSSTGSKRRRAWSGRRRGC